MFHYFGDLAFNLWQNRNVTVVTNFTIGFAAVDHAVSGADEDGGGHLGGLVTDIVNVIGLLAGGAFKKFIITFHSGRLAKSGKLF